jgi:uncharacterized protein
MSTATPRQLFVNLAVKDLPRSKRFFAGLGFTFDPRFTNDEGACLVIGDGAYAMLLAEDFFRSFTKRDLCDTTMCTEALLAVSCGSRGEVDQMVVTAVASGGAHAMEAQDHGFMYGWSFYDPDGHHWEVFSMDPSASTA